MSINVRKAFFLSIFLLLILIPVYSQNNEFKSVEDKEKLTGEFLSRQNSISTLSCSFRQSKYISYLSAQIESHGKFYYKRERLIRWEYTEPYEYAIIMNSGKLRIEGNNKDISFKLRENKYIEKLNELIQDSFCGDVFSNDSYYDKLEENSSYFRLTLMPIDDEIKNIISQVYLFFNKQTLTVTSIVIYEPSNDYTTISFTNHLFNKVIDISKFE